MTPKQKYWKVNNIIQIREYSNNDFYIITDKNKAIRLDETGYLGIDSFDDNLMCVDKDMPEFDVVNIYENIFSR